MSRPDVPLRDQIAALLPRLRRFARTIARHTADADDLVQITLERGLVRLDRWRPDTRLESWMFTIMKNAWIDEVRARGRRARVLAPAEAGENVGDCSAEAPGTAVSVEAAGGRRLCRGGAGPGDVGGSRDGAFAGRPAHRRRAGAGRGPVVQGGRSSRRDP